MLRRTLATSCSCSCSSFADLSLHRHVGAALRRGAAAAAAASATKPLPERATTALWTTPAPTEVSISRPSSRQQRRPFSTCALRPKKAGTAPMPPRPKPPPEAEIDESFLKGSGPGGQKINKTNSAVQLKHLPTGIVVKCQATRSRSQNRTIARQLLADRLDDIARGDQSRAAIVGEARRKKRASSAKKSRRKYRKLDEVKKAAGLGAMDGVEFPEEEAEGEDEDWEDLEEDIGEHEAPVEDDKSIHSSTNKGKV
ncbi:RF-1 domain-containing protein [Xylariales sp. PMI_506]|nr:RF-1 domain-containing protein [Xylariales sp. PMI_506]